MGVVCCKEEEEEEEIDFNQGPELAHFQLLKIIGQGVFGKVRIIQHKRTKKQYALKYIDKSICIRQKAIGNVILERNLLERIEYPFITNLRYAFQDDETLFMALDLMRGGDLRLYLNQHLICHELQVRHHVACIALSLNYLHNRRIAHRDIKPENILLDQKGYAHLSDFNIAIQFDPGQPLLWSMAGTMAYMAPEMLARKGYSTYVDWWSLGVVLFELVFGKRPFRAVSKEQLVHAILHDPLTFPPNTHVSKECMDVMIGLLDKSPFHRLGFEEFKSHPWFRGFDWDLLEHKQLMPPIQPDKKNKLRMMNYTEFQEDGLKSHKRTSVIKSYDHDSSPVTMEARYRMQLEDEFLNYDYTQHQMAEQEGGHFSSFLEQRRNSLKRQYDRFKRRSQSSYHDMDV
ncbi:kinase-like domain-containing protein [Choanephora cucurbitarum]|nr:kinase-like domain-containing protein [Choanephora cucurbitarum]